MGHFEYDFENFGICLTLEKFALTSADRDIYRIATKAFSFKLNDKCDVSVWKRQATLKIIVDL